MKELPVGIVTFLFTDVEGSTRLLDELGKDAYAAVLAEHREVLRAAFAAQGGVEVDTQGDAFFVGFPTASGALAAAAEAQQRLESGPVRVRMGVHTGEPLRTEEAYVGMAVHTAARIAGAAHGGQVLVSEATRQLLDDDSALRDLGLHRLKDLSAPQRLFQLGAEEFPRPRTLPVTNLPVPATPFLGREREVADVVELLARPDVRLVTLTGPGGTGKTRLALHAAGLVAGEYEQVVWVPLAPLRDSALVLPTVAAKLGAPGGEDRSPVAAVTSALRGTRTLLVLDNLEHVIEAAGELGRVIAGAPELDVLVTSREVLQLQGEHGIAVEPLRREEARALFVARARAVLPSFEGDDAVDELCDRLDDLPLAIELAAARVRALTPKALLQRLAGRLDTLRGGRDADDRQRTLRATIEWSYELLDAEEQRVLAVLSVFRGGATLEAVEAVCETDVAVVESLVDKSLLRRRDERDGDRYWLLTTIGEFAAERLAASSDAEAVRNGHARLVESFVASVAQESLERLGEGPAADAIERELDNVRAVLELREEHGDTAAIGSLVTGVWLVWYRRGSPLEGIRWCELALAGTLDESLRAAVENALAALLMLTGEERGAALAEASADRARRLGDAHQEMYSSTTVGNFYSIQGEKGSSLDRGLAAYERAIELAGQVGADAWGVAVEANVGVLLLAAGEFDRAERHFRALRDSDRARVSPLTQAQIEWGLGVVELTRRSPEAVRLLRRAFVMSREAGWATSDVENILGLGVAAAFDGRRETALRLIGAADALCERHGTRAEPVLEVLRADALDALRIELADGEIEHGLARGRQLALDEAVALALDET